MIAHFLISSKMRPHFLITNFVDNEIQYINFKSELSFQDILRRKSDSLLEGGREGGLLLIKINKYYKQNLYVKRVKIKKLLWNFIHFTIIK